MIQSLKFVKRVVPILLLHFLICLPVADAQPKPTPEYQVKAAFLYNFTRFIEWPASAFHSGTSPFVIGLAGNDPFGKYIDDLIRGEKVGNHPIVIKRFTNLKDIVNCHILFISSKSTFQTDDVVSLASNRHILTVGEGENFTDQGGMISFYKENNKVRFQINTATSKTARLEISSKLLSVAKVSGEN